MRSQIIIYGNHYLLRYCPSEHQIRGWMHFLAPWASIFDWFFSCSLVRVHHIKCATFWIACDSNLPFHDNLHGHIPFLSFDHLFSPFSSDSLVYTYSKCALFVICVCVRHMRKKKYAHFICNQEDITFKFRIPRRAPHNSFGLTGLCADREKEKCNLLRNKRPKIKCHWTIVERPSPT